MAKSSLAANGGELNTVQNCTAPAGVTEADATTGWTQYFCSAFSSAAIDPQLGKRHISAIASNLGCLASYTFPALDSSKMYKVSGYQKRASGTHTWNCFPSKMQALTVDTSAWTETSGIFKGGSSSAYVCAGTGVLAEGDTLYIDNISVKEITPCFGSELNTIQNAGAPIANEADSTSGWHAFNSLDSLVSISHGCAEGSYCLAATDAGDAGMVAGFSIDLGSAAFNLSDGHKYFVSYSFKHNGMGNKSWSCGFTTTNSGIDDVPFEQVYNTDTAYRDIGLQLNYSSATRYFTCQEQNPALSGGSGIYLDNFSVKEILSLTDEICGDEIHSARCALRARRKVIGGPMVYL